MAAKPNLKEDGFCEGIYGGNSDGAEPQKIELYKLTNKKSSSDYVVLERGL